MSREQTRRQWLKTAAAAGTASALGLAGCTDGGNGNGDDVTEETLRLGVFQPTSGDLQYYGQTALQGFYCGLAYKYDDVEPLDGLTPGEYEIDPEDGPTFELVVEDTEFSPDTAQRVAEGLVADDEVDILIGGTSSDSTRRIIDNVVRQTDVPLLCGPAADVDVTASSENCHERVFRASEHSGMDARSGASYVAEEMDVENIAMFGSNDSFGRGGVDSYSAVFEEYDHIDLQEPRLTEPGYAEFEGLLDEAVANGADAVGGVYTFITLPNFIPTAMDYDVQIFGGFAEMVTVDAIGGAVQQALGEGFTTEDIEASGLGPFTTRYHWNQFDNPINEEFIEMNLDAYGQLPDLYHAGTFTTGSALIQAIEESGSIEPDDIVDALTGMTVEDTPKGEDGYQFREENNQAASEMAIAPVVPTSDEWGEYWQPSVMPGDPIQYISPDDAMVPAEDLSCDLS